jgi:prevent-host-death family protein
MEKTVSALDARRQFGSLLNDVDARGERVIVTRRGEPVAALVAITVYE